MLLRLQQYDYTIVYRPGKEMVLPDCLSRLPKQGVDETIEMDVQVSFVQFSNTKLAELKHATAEDEQLHSLTKYILDGFPERQRDLPSDIRQYWSCRDELSIENGLLIKGQQLIIPTTLRPEYLAKVHEGHQGITRCQARARMSIYWPGISKDIENIVKECYLCQKHQDSQPKEPLEPITPNIPQQSWHTLSMDLFHLNDKTFLIIVDYHSKFPVIHDLGHSLSSRHVAEVTSSTFGLFGIPNCVITDNGPQFIGQPFKDLMESYHISHVTSSPHHSKSHGFVERTIRTVKALMRKSPLDSDRALLAYRTTPLGPQLPSPAEILFGRKIQTDLPAYNQLIANEQLQEYRAASHAQSQARYDRSAKELSELSPNEPVFFQEVGKKTWSPGTIIGCGPEPRSYTVRCESTGRALRRNRILLRPRQVAFDLPLTVIPPEDVTCPDPPALSVTPSSPQTAQTNRSPQPLGQTTPPTPPDVTAPTTPPIRRSSRQRKPVQRLIEQL